MYRHILVAVDGSDTSNLALQQATTLAKDQGGGLRLIHVVDETSPFMLADSPFPIAEYQKILREAGQKVLAQSADTVRQAAVPFDTKFAVIDGLKQRVCDAINAEAASWPADLIVIGTHGRRGFSHLLLGSVAEGVIRLAAKPVLIIRAA